MLFKCIYSHPLSRLQGDVGPHAPGDAWGACTDLLRRTWKQNIQVKTNFKTKAPNVKMLDLRSTILCRSNLSLISLQAWTMLTSWRRARRHRAASGPKGLIRTFNFHFHPKGLARTRSTITLAHQCPNIRISSQRKFCYQQPKHHSTSDHLIAMSCPIKLIAVETNNKLLLLLPWTISSDVFLIMVFSFDIWDLISTHHYSVNPSEKVNIYKKVS